MDDEIWRTLNFGGTGGRAHWALEHTEVILKFQTWRYQPCFRVSVLDLWALALGSGLWSIFELEMFPPFISNGSEFARN